MNDDKTATLYVSRVANEGWTKVKGTDEQDYWYLFDGGTGGGNFHGKKHEKNVEFVVGLDADKDMRVHNVQFDDNDGQLAFDEKKSNHKRAVISDENKGELKAYYAVIVARESGGRVIEIRCDPMIKNDPRT